MSKELEQKVEQLAEAVTFNAEEIREMMFSFMVMSASVSTFMEMFLTTDQDKAVFEEKLQANLANMEQMMKAEISKAQEGAQNG